MGGICEVVLGGLGVYSSPLPCSASPAPSSEQMDEDDIDEEIELEDLDDVDLGNQALEQQEPLQGNRVSFDDIEMDMEKRREMERWKETGAYPPEGTWQNKWYRLADLEKRKFGYPGCAQVMGAEAPVISRAFHS